MPLPTSAVSEPSLKTRVFSGATWSFVDNATQQVLSLLIFVVLGRILSPALFGIVSTAMVFVFLMRSVVLNAVMTGTLTLRHPQDEDYDTCFLLSIGIAGVFLIGLNLGAGALANLYRIDSFENVIRATSVVVLLFGLSQAHSAWARRNFKFRALAMRSTISTLIGGGVGIAIALAGYGLVGLVINQVLTAVVSMALLWRALPWRPRLRFASGSARRIMATALPHGATQTFQFLAQNFDIALVTYLVGPAGGGLYAAAKRVTLAVNIAIWGPLSSVSLPAFAEVTNDPARFGNAAVRISSLVTGITAPLLIGIATTATSLIPALFGARWQAAAPVMTVLALFAVVTPMTGILNQILLSFSRARTVFGFTLAQMVLAMAAMFAFGRDPVRIALCLSIPAVVSYLGMLALAARSTPFPLVRYLLGVGRPLACGAIMAAAVLLVPDFGRGPLVQLIAEVAVGGIVYGIAFVVIARETFGEVVAFAGSRVPERFQRRRGDAATVGMRAPVPLDPEGAEIAVALRTDGEALRGGDPAGSRR